MRTKLMLMTAMAIAATSACGDDADDPHAEGDCASAWVTGTGSADVCERACRTDPGPSTAPASCSALPQCNRYVAFDGQDGCCNVKNELPNVVVRWTECE